MDHFEFIDESEGHTAPNFNDSFLAIFAQDSSSDEDFEGFGERQIQLGNRVESFHTRQDNKRLAEKENLPPSTRPKKRKSKPERYSSNDSECVIRL